MCLICSCIKLPVCSYCTLQIVVNYFKDFCSFTAAPCRLTGLLSPFCPMTIHNKMLKLRAMAMGRMMNLLRKYFKKT